MIGVDPLCEYFYVEKYKLSIFVKLNACGLNKFAFKYTWPLIPTYCSKKNPWTIIYIHRHDVTEILLSVALNIIN
jgi:hypothetical protein